MRSHTIARAQPRELIGRVATGQHVEHRFERVAREVGEVRAAAHQREQVVDVPVVDRARGDDLLREHVERQARVAHLLDQAFAHAAHDHGRLEQVAAPLREDLAGARLADVVTGPPDPLHPTRDRARRLDEHDEIDGAHVDAELERRCRDEPAQATRLQLVFDEEPLLAGEGAVVRARRALRPRAR